MADEISPTMEEKEVVAEEPQPEVTEQMSEENQLLETLRAASISKAEQLDGTIRNAQKTYDMQSERDRLANQLSAMEQRLAEAEKKSTVPDSDDYGQPVDLDSAIAKGVGKVLDQRDRAAAENQQRMMKSWANISQDEDFKLVESIWNEKLKDPNFVYGVQSGQVDPEKAYAGVLRSYYKGIAKSAVKTIETLSKGVTPQMHIESGEARAPNVQVDSEISDRDKFIKEMKEKADSGGLLSEDDEIAAIRAVLSG